MDATQTIRASVTEVDRLRHSVATDPVVAEAVAAVKRFQSRRFQRSYQDLIAGGPYRTAAVFFLEELYGDADYAKRDAQFSRIAGAIQRLLPKPAVTTAVALAQLHALTERLDHAMGSVWHERSRESGGDLFDHYIHTWRAVGQRGSRERQLHLVLEIGKDLENLTRTPGLRMMLRMMRRPAHAAGLTELQHFLERGFDTFAEMGRKKPGATEFLRIVQARESELIGSMFDQSVSACRLALGANAEASA